LTVWTPTEILEGLSGGSGVARRLNAGEMLFATVAGQILTDAGLVGLDGNTIGFGLLLSDDRDIVGSVEFLAPGVLRDVLPDFLELSRRCTRAGRPPR
jgi:hypothetical protein